MDKNAKIYVAGHRGLVGSAIVKSLLAQGYTNLITRTHAELDLTSQTGVADFFANEKPVYVFLAAAKVGGIHANNTYPAEFIHENLAIQSNVIHQSYIHGVTRLLFLGSSCIYPKEAPQPIKEEHLLTGQLEPTNRPYALAKIAGIEMCWSYNRQYSTQFLAAMPTNLYGPGDNYHPENSHVIPALIRKFHEAKVNNLSEVVVWGTGSPKREFLYNQDMADACIFLMQLEDRLFRKLLGSDKFESEIFQPPLINIGYGSDITIKDLAEKISAVVGYQGNIHFDILKPDGTLRKLMDSSKLFSLGHTNRVSLESGLAHAYNHFKLVHTQKL